MKIIISLSIDNPFQIIAEPPRTKVTTISKLKNNLIIYLPFLMLVSSVLNINRGPKIDRPKEQFRLKKSPHQKIQECHY